MYLVRFSLPGLYRVWMLLLLIHFITDYDPVGAHRTERGISDICLSGQRCYGDLGCFPCFKGFHAQSPQKINMTFYLYTPNGVSGSLTNDNVQIIPYVTFNRSVQSAGLDSQKTLWVITHGFEGQWPLPWLELMREALVQKGNNVLVARWSDGTAYPGNYAQACSNGRLVGVMIAQVVTEFEQNKNVSLDRVNLVGFSLGPHVVGAAGQALKGRARQIVGLDPANQFFHDAAPEFRLDETDAQMVQVIHTNGAPLSKGVNLGTMVPMGDIDIYVNGGELQPGCPVTALSKISTESIYANIETIGCNHLRAPAIFTTSIKRNDCKFKAYPCNSVDDWYSGECFSCTGRGCVGVGYQMDSLTTQRGMFFLATQVDEGLREGDYCGPQYHITLKPDREVRGEIKIVLKNDTASILPNMFQKKGSTMTTEGKSVVIAARVTNPTQLMIAYDRYNTLVKKGTDQWNLANATVSLDDGTTFYLTAPATIIDDRTTSARLGSKVMSGEMLASVHATNYTGFNGFSTIKMLFLIFIHVLFQISFNSLSR